MKDNIENKTIYKLRILKPFKIDGSAENHNESQNVQAIYLGPSARAVSIYNM
jgi:hypothetical protein